MSHGPDFSRRFDAGSALVGLPEIGGYTGLVPHFDEGTAFFDGNALRADLAHQPRQTPADRGVVRTSLPNIAVATMSVEL